MSGAANSKRRLTEDESGALLLIGSIMGSLLVAALWYVASVGDAIIWRENAQNAADAAAFENAVWNARGMNVLVMLNMLMAMVMSFLVLWRLTVMLIFTIVAIIAIGCAIGFLIPNPLSTFACTLTRFAAQLTQKAVQMRARDNRIANAVARITHGMSVAQKVVSGAIPPIGTILTLNDTREVFDGAVAFNVSVSMLPRISPRGGIGKGNDAGFECDTKEDKQTVKQALKDSIQSRIGYVFSLPAQEEIFAVLCQRAGEFIPNNIAGFIERVGGPREFVAGLDTFSGIIGPIAGSVPTLFCAPHGDGFEKFVSESDAIKSAAKDVCDQQSKPVRVNGRDVFRKPDPKNPGEFLKNEFDTTFDMKACLSGQAQKANLAGKAKDAAVPKIPVTDGVGPDGKPVPVIGSNGKPLQQKPTCSRPFKVWDYAANGNFAMQSWAYVSKEIESAARDDKGLEVGDGSQTGNLVAVGNPPLIGAQAEMYYDCARNSARGSTVGGLTWEDCRGNAPWTLNWRARLRRLQRMEDMAARAGERLLVESVVNGANKVFGRALKGFAVGRGVPDMVAENLRDTWVTQQLRNEVRRVPYRGFDSIADRLTVDPPTDPVVIH